MLLARRRLEQQEKERAQAQAEAAKRPAPPSPPPPVEEKKEPELAPRPPKGLNKADLAAFAKEHFGAELDPDAFKAAELFEEVNRLADKADEEAAAD